MKDLIILCSLISLGLMCSCQKQDSTVGQQPLRGKEELDAREQALDERVNALEEKVNVLNEKLKALNENTFTNARPTASNTQSQNMTPDPAQMKAENDNGMQQLPADVQPLIADPLQGDPAKVEKDGGIQERLAQTQRDLESQQRSRQRKWELTQKWRMSGAAASPAVETTSPNPP
jgi:hypothetical protein